MTVALKARQSHDAREAIEMFSAWTSMSPAEREEFIRRVREEVPGAVKLADAFERLHRKSLAAA